MMEQTVLITEAHQPWCQALGQYFADKQWMVIACLPERELAKVSLADHERIRLVPLDVQSRESVQSAASRIQEMTDSIDMIVCQTVTEDNGEAQGLAGMSTSVLLESFNANALGPIRLVEAMLPMMKKGLKRIALLTDPTGSLGLALPGTGLGYSMSKAALHMAFTMMHGDLSREGFTFRLYAPFAENSVQHSAEAAFRYFTLPREDEERMVLMDQTGAELPL